MSWFDPLLLLAQIPKSDLTDIDALPTSFGDNNVQNGLVVAFGIAGGIALVVMAYGGLKFVLSQGNPQEVTKAKNTIIDGLIGLAVIVGAAGIVGFVVSALT
ncbi:MAG TPA: pilin [Candidatus Limnocylindria bacterium]|nr:pilin [Candidatus Limnocylindria bacterium]